LKPLRILIIRFSSIGDIVLTTPVIRCIKKQKPEAEIYLLTKASFAGVLKPNPYLSGIISFDGNLSSTVKELKAIGFDYIIDLHHNQRSFLIKCCFPFTKKYSFDKLNFEKWLMVNFKINRLPHKHIVDRYFDAQLPLGIENDGEGLDFYINKEEAFDVLKLPAEHQQGFIVFSIGGNHATKKMPVEKWKQLAALINYPVVVLGGKEEAAEGAEIADELKVLNLCGKTTLHESASIIQQSKLVVTHDTGLMHIAAALKKPVISIWGNTIPAFGMEPYYGNHFVSSMKAEVDNLNCRPCSKLGHKKCPEGHFNCMMKQDVTKITETVKQWLASH
jgi:ADP-heptose:LPS heptosyltransferase